MSEGNKKNQPPFPTNGKKNGDKNKKGDKKKSKPARQRVTLEAIREAEEASTEASGPARTRAVANRDPASGDYYDSIPNVWPSSEKCQSKPATAVVAEEPTKAEPQPSTSTTTADPISQIEALAEPLEEIIGNYFVPVLLVWSMLNARKKCELEAKKRKEKEREEKEQDPKDPKEPKDPKDPEGPPPPPLKPEWNTDELD
ncbi:hypothetical protein Trydic_g12005 [Trypoxylus dichotomus]